MEKVKGQAPTYFFFAKFPVRVRSATIDKVRYSCLRGEIETFGLYNMRFKITSLYAPA